MKKMLAANTLQNLTVLANVSAEISPNYFHGVLVCLATRPLCSLYMTHSANLCGKILPQRYNAIEIFKK